MAILYAVDAQGRYLGSFDGVPLPDGAREVEVPPEDGRAIWTGDRWEMPVPSPAELTAEIVAAVSAYLDQQAQARRYDGILSLCTYATSTDVVFAAEGQAGVDFRDACWRYCYDALAEVKAGKRAIPLVQEFVAELPSLAWPAEAVPA